MGDRIIEGIGLSTWSNGTTGLHYSGIYSLILIIIAWTGINLTFDKRHPKVTKIILLLILLLILIPMILNL